MKHVVVIPAAGAGARFYELGKQYPKCLLPYQGKPIIQHLVEKIEKDICPDEIRIVVKKEDLYEPLWDCVASLSTIVPVNTKYTQGPATSLLSGLDCDDDMVTVVLSDMVLCSDFPLSNCRYSIDIIYCYTHVQNQSRWCLYDDKEFFDKPKEQIHNAYALLGCYHFTDARLLRNILYKQVSVAVCETQFSTALREYGATHKINQLLVNPNSVVDLGTLEEFISKRSGIMPRKFNTVIYNKMTVTKKSMLKEKIHNEAMWLSYPPIAYKNCVPNVVYIDLNKEEGSYTMERLYGHNLRELALYYDQSYDTWVSIFQEVWKLLSCSRQEKTEGCYWVDFIKRVESRCMEQELHLTSGEYEELSETLLQFTNKTTYHGDLHFANMFWCSGGCIKVVDPRGEYYGHWLYDVAKLYHSVFGMYDYIDEGLYSIKDGEPVYYDRGSSEIKRAFLEMIYINLTQQEQKAVRLVSTYLFLSMIPLHENEEHKSLFKKEFQRLYKAKPPVVTGGICG